MTNHSCEIGDTKKWKKIFWKIIELSFAANAFSGNYTVLSNLVGHLRPYSNILRNLDITFYDT